MLNRYMGDVMKKHILVVSQNFYPEQFRINDICQEWIKLGYKVTVLTGIPNYPKGDFYEGYGLGKKRKEIWEGIEIIRIPIIPRKNNKLFLALNYMSFVVSGFFWSIVNKISADYVFIYETSPMTQALPGVWYAKRKCIPCYIYVLDLWPENVESVLNIHNKMVLRPIDFLVDYVYKRCDKIFTSSNSFIYKIQQRGININKLEFWPQYAEDFYCKYTGDENVKEIPQDGILNLTFAGNVGYAQGLDILAESAVKLKEQEIKVRFNIIGDGRYKNTLLELVKAENVVEYFNFIDKKPAKDIPKYFAYSDAALITLAKSEVFSMTIPAKLQSCMACGIPILAAIDGEAQSIIKEADCGLCCDSSDAIGLTNIIIAFKDMQDKEIKSYAKNAFDYYNKHFDKRMLLEKVNKYFNK